MTCNISDPVGEELSHTYWWTFSFLRVRCRRKRSISVCWNVWSSRRITWFSPKGRSSCCTDSPKSHPIRKSETTRTINCWWVAISDAFLFFYSGQLALDPFRPLLVLITCPDLSESAIWLLWTVSSFLMLTPFILNNSFRVTNRSSSKFVRSN